MTIIVVGKRGEAKTCVANIIRHAVSGFNVPDMVTIPFIDWEIAHDVLGGERIEIRIVEKEEGTDE